MNSELDLETIYKDFREPLKAFILKRVSDRSSAEDLLHDVFVRIHNQIGSLKDQGKLTPWIYQIARNAIVDSIRKHRETIEPSDELISPERHAINDVTEDLIPVVRTMVEKLPDKYREPLLLSDFKGINQAEVAERLGISLSAAKSRIQRARRMLKELLLQCCHFEFDRYGTVFDYHSKKCSNCCEGRDKNDSPLQC